MKYVCNLCPRSCMAERTKTSGSGVCACGRNPVLAKAAVHMWEEPCISGSKGSGAVFFSGCSLKCCYCQNSKISTGAFGKAVTSGRLRQIFFELADKGVHNINLVNPTHFSEGILAALEGGLPIPVVYNSGGYDNPETLRLFEGLVQIYMPDMKYALSVPAGKYSFAPDYPQTAKKAILEMYRQTGPYVIGSDGILISGVIIRHLVLPNNLENTFRVIDWVNDTFKPGQVLFSLMSQYIPAGNIDMFPELSRTITEDEYNAAVKYLLDSGIEDGFYQELSSASDIYVPDFDLSGI